MITQILIGGKAGQGPNILTQLVAEALVKKGIYVFTSRDYESLIRGGHNFNTLTFSDKEVYSNESKLDILVCLDEETEKIHEKDLKKTAFILSGKHENMFFAGMLFKLLCLDFSLLENELKKLRNFDENIKQAKEGYKLESRSCNITFNKPKERVFQNGSQAAAEGAIKSGLDIYYAYPMTPATPILFELAPKQVENNFLTLEVESEVSAVMAALGSSITGAKTMTGTSGGGFDLMTEGISMACQAEIPLVIYLAQRPGPGTGVATATSQGDLNLALYSGHGESFRIVLAPGDAKESQELISQCFYLTQEHKLPAIFLTDKHLSESFYTYDEKPNMIKSNKSTELKKYNSYEHDEKGIATENIELVKKGFEKREKKKKEIEKEVKKFRQYNIYGNKNSKNVIISWGSTKGAILDAITGLDCKFIQVLYISPFADIKKEIKGKNIIAIENSSNCQIADLIKKETGITIEEKNKILKYNGEPFFSDELKEEIRKRLR